MSTNRRGKWGSRGTGPNGNKLCYCGCGEELPASMKRNTSMPGHWKRWAAIHDAATVRRIVEERDHGVCALCGVDTHKRAQEANQTKRLIGWLARAEAEAMLERGELQFYPGFTKNEKSYAAYVREHEKPAKPGHHDAYRWAGHWVEEEMKRRFGTTTSGNGHTWEADHIIPVIEGGGECGLDNYRTLCLPCHHKETAALARRRAERRRQEKISQIKL